MMAASTSQGRARSDRLRRIAREKSERKRRAAFEAIHDLADPVIGRGRPITQAAVARRAGVSTVFLRSHDDLLQAIAEAERVRPAGLAGVDPDARARDTIIASLRRRVAALKEEVETKNAIIRQKQCEIDQLYGKLAAKSTLADPDLRQLYQGAMERVRKLEGDGLR